MQVNVIQGAGAAGFDYMMFPEQAHSSQAYLQQQLTRFSDTLTDVGKGFLSATKTLYESVANSDAIRKAKAAIRLATGMFHPNMIRPLETLEDLQSAQPMMQRYIMAEPTIRKLYHEQKCDGYNDSYVDVEPDRIGETHHDYQRVMTGVVQEVDNEDGSSTWRATQYYHEPYPDEADLTANERVDIINTWEYARLFAETLSDPTNIFGGTVGA